MNFLDKNFNKRAKKFRKISSLQHRKRINHLYWVKHFEPTDFKLNFILFLKFLYNISALNSLILLKSFSGLYLKSFYNFISLNFYLKKLNYNSLVIKIFNFFKLSRTVFNFKLKDNTFKIKFYDFKNSINLFMKFKNIKRLTFLNFFIDIINFYKLKNKFIYFKENLIKEVFKRRLRRVKKIRAKWPFLKLT